MPARSKVTSLPDDVRAWLDSQLVAGSFSDYEGLAQALQDKGFEISKSSVYRYGRAFESRLGALKLATEQAKAIATEVGDDEGALSDGLVRLVQQRMFEVLVDLSAEDIDIGLADIGHVAAKLAKATIDQRKWATDLRRKLDERLNSLEASGDKGGTHIDPATLQRIRSEIYGIL